jgi:D-glycero-D-manno-heptose 1,7-bisphosphate phosphatase
MKIIFLDRDDTLIKDKNYMKDPNLIEFFPDTINALRMIQDLGYHLILITNQSGIGRGLVTEEEVKLIHQKLQMVLMNFHLSPLIEIQYCPHAPETNCECRKPKTLMIERMIKKYRLDRSNCYMIGDRMADYEAGINAGLQSYMIYKHEKNVPHFPDLLSFAQFLKNQT